MHAKLNNCVTKRETCRVQTKAIAISKFFSFTYSERLVYGVGIIQVNILEPTEATSIQIN
jgi:hypothetical protein